MAEQRTVGEASRSLRMSRKTLDKWLDRLGIEPQRHAFDYHFYTITDEELQNIREAHAQMPKSVSTGAFIPSYSSPAFDRRSTADGDVRHSLVAPLAPTPRLRTSRATSTESRSKRRGRGEATGNLPDWMMSITEAERLHGIPASNRHRWTNQSFIEADPGAYLGEHDILADMPNMPDTSIKSAGQTE